jgi:phage terminase Nu1 subunit (DNA packaging protein)
MPLPKKPVSSTDLATLLGVTKRSINLLAEQGVLPRLANEQFDLSAALQAYVLHREGVIEAQHGLGDYGKARAELYQEKAEMAKMQRQKLQSELLPIDAVRLTWTNIVVHVRGALLALPSKLAPRLLMKHSASEVQDIIRVAVFEVLENLAGTEVKVARKNGDGQELEDRP